MPILMDLNSHDHHLFRGEENDRAVALPASAKATAGGVNIGLINNMPDSALISTERQLFELLNAAAGKLPVRLRLYALPMVPRTDWGREYISRFYSTVDDLWESDLDGLIVTGAEPQAPNLVEEPYWSSLGRIIDWARENTVSSVWSCLAVHSAVLHLDGIDRRKLEDKCIGIFEHARMTERHPLMRGVPSRLRVPHSRWNEVREVSLSSCGYSVLTKSADAGVDLFVKQQKKSLFVYFQGHPEYEALSLLGEYRRDVGRFLRREICSYPTMPKGYFDDQAGRILTAFQRRAISDRRNDLFAAFPIDRVTQNLKNTWQSAAKRIYRNWIMYVLARRTRRLGVLGSAVSKGSAASH
jgi:homoserine O-succinyltransferase/O-acetyltransferase